MTFGLLAVAFLALFAVVGICIALTPPPPRP